jgi:hypothetical protein
MNGANRIGTKSLDDVPDIGWKIVGTNDFNGDGSPDLMWRHSKTGKNGVWYMNGANQINKEYFVEVDGN